jgi:hypothetical protein
MAYVLYIERRGPDGALSPITLQEWQIAVRESEGVRLSRHPVMARNPKTGEKFPLPYAGEDAAVHSETEGKWIRVFHWFKPGRIRFSAPLGFDKQDSEIGVVARALAAKLGAAFADDPDAGYEPDSDYEDLD